MRPIATVLYEDTMLPSAGGNYPLHDLVMRFVEDHINGWTWKLQKAVFRNPRKGIGNVLNDVERTSLLAGAGELYLLVDRDVVAKHLKLSAAAKDQDVIAALRAKSDAPNKLHPFFLYPNLEGLLRAVQACDLTLLPDTVASALRKKLNDRDIVLNEVKKARMTALRTCVAEAQPGIDGLAKALAALIQAKVVPWP